MNTMNTMNTMNGQRRYLKLNDIIAYKDAFHLANKIWEEVKKWDIFAKDTVGKQFVRAVDSVSANIAEGFGRRHKKDKEKFYYNARGSVFECLDWLQKARERKLISDCEYKKMFSGLKELPREVNELIRFTEKRMK